MATFAPDIFGIPDTEYTGGEYTFPKSAEERLQQEEEFNTWLDEVAKASGWNQRIPYTTLSSRYNLPQSEKYWKGTGYTTQPKWLKPGTYPSDYWGSKIMGGETQKMPGILTLPSGEAVLNPWTREGFVDPRAPQTTPMGEQVAPQLPTQALPGTQAGPATVQDVLSEPVTTVSERIRRAGDPNIYVPGQKGTQSGVPERRDRGIAGTQSGQRFVSEAQRRRLDPNLGVSRGQRAAELMKGDPQRLTRALTTDIPGKLFSGPAYDEYSKLRTDLYANSPSKFSYDVNVNKAAMDALSGRIRESLGDNPLTTGLTSLANIAAIPLAMLASPIHEAYQVIDEGRMEPGSGIKGWNKAFWEEQPLSTALNRGIGVASALPGVQQGLANLFPRAGFGQQQAPMPPGREAIPVGTPAYDYAVSQGLPLSGGFGLGSRMGGAM